MCYISSTVSNTIFAAAIQKALETCVVGRRVIYKPVVSSTMTVARREALSNAAEGTVVIAGRQSAGRGRMERVWVSPPGSLALSVLLYPRPDFMPILTMMAALAVSTAVKAVAGPETVLKWPNDVLIGGRKVSGILAESGTYSGRNYAVLGIGINVNNPAAALGGVSYPATSLLEELGRQVSLVELAVSLLSEIDRLYVSNDRRAIYEEWRNRLETVGRRISLVTEDSVYQGVAESVDDDGNLRLRLDDGRLVLFAAGDVSLRSLP